MATFWLRDAEAADRDELADVYRRSSLSNEGDRPHLLAHPDVLELPEIGVDDRHTRVAIDPEGRIIGFATVLPAGGALELDDLFVDPPWMRQGVARQLILDVAFYARSQGIERVEVTANRHAFAFYDSVGFVVDGTIVTQFGPGDRMHLDVSA